MRQWRNISVAILLLTSLAVAQDPSPEQLRKMYDTALDQLKTAQDRKNELAAKNETLTARIAELTAELERVREQVKILERESLHFADRSFSLRAHFAAWQRFMAYYPRLKARWEAYLDGNIFTPPPALVIPQSNAETAP